MYVNWSTSVNAVHEIFDVCKHRLSSHYVVTHMRNKNSNIQGRSPNVVKVIFHTQGTALKGKISLPLGANSFL